MEMSKQYKFPYLLYGAWDEFENYRVELFDDTPVVQDKLVSLLRPINTDLGGGGGGPVLILCLG